MKFSHLTATRSPVSSMRSLVNIRADLACPAGTTPPSLLLTVCGTVLHGPAAGTFTAATSSKTVDSQPRIFTQTFTLAPDTEASTGESSTSVKYYVNSDALRFVG